MPEIQPTAFPWTMLENEHEEEIEIVSPSLADAYSRVVVAKLEQGYEKNKVNGALICALPDLLALAERIAAGGMHYPAYVRQLAEAAIAKAKGETDGS